MTYYSFYKVFLLWVRQKQGEDWLPTCHSVFRPIPFWSGTIEFLCLYDLTFLYILLKIKITSEFFHYVSPYNLSLLLQNSLGNRSKTLYILSKNSLHILSFNLSLYSHTIIKIILTDDFLGTNFTFFLVPFNAAFFILFGLSVAKSLPMQPKHRCQDLRQSVFAFAMRPKLSFFADSSRTIS